MPSRNPPLDLDLGQISGASVSWNYHANCDFRPMHFLFHQAILWKVLDTGMDPELLAHDTA